MKSFLVKNKKPVIKWSKLPDNTFFEGKLPEGYSLAIVPSNPYIILDVDRHGKIDGFDNLPKHLALELEQTLKYKTKNNGMHFWFKYNGILELSNKSSGYGIDLRVGFKGYVVWYPKTDIRNHLHEINDTSKEMNVWLQELFTPKHLLNKKKLCQI
jgi:hypothetical protein